MATETDFTAAPGGVWDVDFNFNLEASTVRLQLFVSNTNTPFATTTQFYDSSVVTANGDADQTVPLPAGTTAPFSVTSLWSFILAAPAAGLNDIALDVDASLRLATGTE